MTSQEAMDGLFTTLVRTEPEKNGNVRRNFGGSLAREEYLIH